MAGGWDDLEAVRQLYKTTLYLRKDGWKAEHGCTYCQLEHPHLASTAEKSLGSWLSCMAAWGSQRDCLKTAKQMLQSFLWPRLGGARSHLNCILLVKQVTKAVYVHAKSLQSCPTLPPLLALWSMGFFRQEYWSGLPFPPPGDLPNPEIKSTSPALQVDSLPLSHMRRPLKQTQI